MAEARALSRLTHSHVASICDYVTNHGRDFIVMEHVPGTALNEMLATGPLPFPEVLRLGRQLVQGLAAAHEARVVHRDIKPSNIRVTDEGDLKSLDFGVARVMSTGGLSDTFTLATASTAPVGTIPYMPPEQILGQEADKRSDVFSAGVVLYEMATGLHPFEEATLAQVMSTILHGYPVRASLLNPSVPVAFDRVVARAMAKNLRKRYRSANELDAALSRLSGRQRQGVTKRPRTNRRSLDARMLARTVASVRPTGQPTPTIRRQSSADRARAQGSRGSLCHGGTQLLAVTFAVHGTARVPRPLCAVRAGSCKLMT